MNYAVNGIRSEEVAKKIFLHLNRFLDFFLINYGHDRISACLKRDVIGWQRHLCEQGLAASTVNNHLASFSAFTSWVCTQEPNMFPLGDPAKGIGELALPPLEPRVLTDDQVRSLKNICDRLERFHQLKGRRRSETAVRSNARPWRDRAIVFVLLSTGLRREELVRLNLEQVSPNTPVELRVARRARIMNVKGKGKTERIVFLSADARLALADYIEKERHLDEGPANAAVFLSARGIPARKKDGRLSKTSINQILNQIGRWHDAEIRDAERHISPLRPHDLRHTFAFQLARATGADAYELERRLGHRSGRYIQRYTNPPEDVSAGYVEEF
ncbi:tyrosine-type recombinase/integrase [Alicyclobacillus dauci]|uniref:Tyrosine-type recombinase/integrase n=1 Tax=Alicyclobacillus dauci TaxID=1475485 RepID=A0ABY6Z1C6_9BACL|nr:tyrosine-type recombinase/integrase [Alicyclobacillus dauci]WAH36487.1 tyrosine-type recombinase/integrase [Alicyclobacillus dauci]